MRRVSALILVTPCSRNRLMTRLVRADMTWGALPVRMVDLSSSQITSRSQCRCSIRQCPRTQASRPAGLAWAASRLVTYSTASQLRLTQRPFFLMVT